MYATLSVYVLESGLILMLNVQLDQGFSVIGSYIIFIYHSWRSFQNPSCLQLFHQRSLSVTSVEDITSLCGWCKLIYRLKVSDSSGTPVIKAHGPLNEFWLGGCPQFRVPIIQIYMKLELWTRPFDCFTTSPDCRHLTLLCSTSIGPIPLNLPNIILIKNTPVSSEEKDMQLYYTR